VVLTASDQKPLLVGNVVVLTASDQKPLLVGNVEEGVNEKTLRHIFSLDRCGGDRSISMVEGPSSTQRFIEYSSEEGNTNVLMLGSSCFVI